MFRNIESIGKLACIDELLISEKILVKNILVYQDQFVVVKHFEQG